jgi:hypothetical protein
VFVVAVDALEAVGRGAEAAAMRERGRARVEEIAACIEDPAWRRRFRHDVVAHRGLLGPTADRPVGQDS